MDCTGLAAALNQRHDRPLLLCEVTLEIGAALAMRTGNRRLALAVIHLVRLNDLALAEDRRGAGVGHSFANAMRHEPSAFVGHAVHPSEVHGGHALFGRCRQVKDQDPLVQLYVAALHDGADRDRAELDV